MSSKEQTTSFWQQILDKALSNHKCMACDRDILEKDLKRIEEHVGHLTGRKRTVLTGRCNVESPIRDAATRRS